MSDDITLFAPRHASASDAELPTVQELLDVDREYRRSRRPILHTERAARRYSALYSPSALARRMEQSEDWVIIDLETPGPNPHWTVVTEWRGVLRGKRVVRGREAECYQYYASIRGPGHQRSGLERAG